MRIVVINYSGNVGKSTVAAHLLKPRLADAPLFSIESINNDASADGVDVETMRAKNFGELRMQVLQLDSAIVDVGASNVETFLKLMQQYDDSHEDFDLFIIPVVKEKKQQADTLNTIRSLTALGIPANKIRVVFNKVEVDESPEEEFPMIFGLASIEQSFVADPEAIIYLNEVFEEMKGVGKSLADLTNDPVDYRARLRELTDPGERSACIHLMGLKMLARTAVKNLNLAFAALTQ